MIQQSSSPKSGKDRTDAVCQHHWIIEVPTGPVSRGSCQLCEEVREFRNYIEAAPWGEDPPANEATAQYPVAVTTQDVEDLVEV